MRLENNALAVFGNPIQHSLSPLVFSYFARQCNIKLSYEKILAINKEDFFTKVDKFFNDGGIAINITSPFKEDAVSVSNNRTPRSLFCNVANFIHRDKLNNLITDTTDGIGLIKDIEINLNYNLTNKKVLIIGSGAVVTSILLDIITKNPKKIDILARNINKVYNIITKFTINIFNDKEKYDIIINASPNIIDNNLFDQIKSVNDNILCYDLSYFKSTLFINKMYQLNKNINCVIGIGMLVEQAAVCFKILFNLTPNTKEVINILKRI